MSFATVFQLDGRGGAREIVPGVEALPASGSVWVHVEGPPRAAKELLAGWRPLPDAAWPVVEEETSNTRVILAGELVAASFVGWTGVADPDSEPRTIRFVAGPELAVSMADDPVPAVRRAGAAFAAGTGPRSIGELFAFWVESPVKELRASIVELEQPMAETEYAVEARSEVPSEELHDLERRIADLRRRCSPLAVMVESVRSYSIDWFDSAVNTTFATYATELRNMTTDLEALHQRARALHTYLGERLADRMNRIVYALTVISAIFLPLSLIAGVLGMNVGIEGASYAWLEAPVSIIAITAALVLLGWFEYWVLTQLGLLERRSKVREVIKRERQTISRRAELRPSVH